MAEMGWLTTAAADSGYAARESGRELQSLVWVVGGGCAVTAAAAEPHVSRHKLIKHKSTKCQLE
ncbi:hypothetical protein D6779_10045 [Candidatus Parcubacteria bacterium]|nr:MAG: hypothetical protein D6779_10045 [Candidatus Parcubacteria bacterium]